MDARFSTRPNARSDDTQQEALYPFGRPGAGAPMRDSSGQVIARRGHVPSVPQPTPSKDAQFVSTKITTSYTLEDLQRKDKLQAEMRSALMEQMQEKERRRKDEKQKGIDEDLRQEEKIRKQIAELNSEYRREVFSREGIKPPSETYHSPTPKAAVSRTVHQRLPTPIPTEEQVYLPPAQTTQVPSRLVYVKELWHEREEMNQKHLQLQQLISQLKEEASNVSRHNIEAVNELETLKQELIYKQPQGRRQPLDPWTTMRDSSRFIPARNKPFAQVGHRLITTEKSNRSLSVAMLKSNQDYSMIESAEVRSQLGKLDGLLDFCAGNGPIPPPVQSRLKVERQETQVREVAVDTRVDESKELPGEDESVPLDYEMKES